MPTTTRRMTKPTGPIHITIANDPETATHQADPVFSDDEDDDDVIEPAVFRGLTRSELTNTHKRLTWTTSDRLQMSRFAATHKIGMSRTKALDTLVRVQLVPELFDEIKGWREFAQSKKIMAQLVSRTSNALVYHVGTKLRVVPLEEGKTNKLAWPKWTQAWLEPTWDGDTQAPTDVSMIADITTAPASPALQSLQQDRVSGVRDGKDPVEAVAEIKELRAQVKSLTIELETSKEMVADEQKAKEALQQENASKGQLYNTIEDFKRITGELQSKLAWYKAAYQKGEDDASELAWYKTLYPQTVDDIGAEEIVDDIEYPPLGPAMSKGAEQPSQRRDTVISPRSKPQSGHQLQSGFPPKGRATYTNLAPIRASSRDRSGAAQAVPRKSGKTRDQVIKDAIAKFAV